ncbi:hypothetical protein DW094_15170 [Ruminococcaceae bacterium AM07-15]|nr:hypothetical protein DW094_15170 [Ruminococcaceae bacterium AM07-15]
MLTPPFCCQIGEGQQVKYTNRPQKESRARSDARMFRDTDQGQNQGKGQGGRGGRAGGLQRFQGCLTTI